MAEKPATTKRTSGVPSREALIAFVRDNPDRATKRDLAKAFNLKGDDRVALKHLLAELEEDGLFEKRGKRLAVPGELPPVCVLEITGRDRDGALIARPVNHEGDGPAPKVRVSVPSNPRAKLVIPGVGDRVLARTRRDDGANPDSAYSARVIKRLERDSGPQLGVIERLSNGQYRVLPVERRGDEMEVAESDLNGAGPGDLVEIDVQKRGRYGLASASVRERIGKLGSEKAVSMIAIHAHEIPHVFARDTLDEAARANPPALTAPREDWRDLPLITIDPADAKDHDDAVFARPDDDGANPGGQIVTVAIADVAHFVRAGSALDREARLRGNSVYFPDRVVPMLPERISNDLCSLRDNEDRPAMAVRLVFDRDGRKLRHSFHRVMMRSHAKLSYEQAQAAIDGAPDETTGPILATILEPLWAAYGVMGKGRKARQPLELDLPERKIRLGPDGSVKDVVVPPRLDAHKLIEECMIQANVAAAETLEKARQPLVYRVHDSPSLARQESLREFLKTLDIGLARGAQMRPSAFNAILERVAGTDQAELVNAVVLRSQAQAEYSPDNYGHFGLNLQRYAHFTSPIRRYADLLVHRALVSALDLGEDGLTKGEADDLREIAAQISKAERRAVNAERDTVDRLIADHLKTRVGDAFAGRVAGLSKAGLFVSLPQFGADGFVPASTLGDEYFRFEEAAQAMVGEQSGHGYRLGDAVDIRIAEVQALAGSMRFEMLTEPRDLGFGRQSRHKANRRKPSDRRKGGAKQGSGSRTGRRRS